MLQAKALARTGRFVEVTGLVGGEELREAGAGIGVLQHVWVRGLGLLCARRASVNLPKYLCAFCSAQALYVQLYSLPL